MRREYIQDSIQLSGESGDGTFERTFKVVSEIATGSSAVCYEAYHAGSGKGILKEFYPRDTYGRYILERSAGGQLVCVDTSEKALSCFYEERDEYVAPCKKLLEIQQSAEQEAIATFIPPFEIYNGCGENSTVYIWSPTPKLLTFDKVCDDIHRHPKSGAEYKFVLIIDAIRTLANCIKELHSAGIIHRDIKPSNFGFLERNKEILLQTLSLFDINSICDVSSGYRYKESMGTPGYMAPEALYRPADTLIDIYSIGATLFHALIVTEETKAGDFLYQDDYYEKLESLVNGSSLIQAAGLSNRLRKRLSNILRKCLNTDLDDRYQCCEDFMDDLDMALSNYGQTQKEARKKYLQDLELSSILPMQYNLYNHPLYSAVPPDEKDINVLIMGLGGEGQKFLDACLQLGQMRGKTLNVTVILDDVRDRERYIAGRPTLSKFFNVDGSLEGTDAVNDSYGNVIFEVQPALKTLSIEESGVLESILRGRDNERKKQHYLFIDLGRGELNLKVADACRNIKDTLIWPCGINFVWDEETPPDVSAGIVPVLVGVDVTLLPGYNEIERMAFNTHLIWEKDFNVSYEKIKDRFNKPYNYSSCVSNVLSLKYKLFSMGINMDTCTFLDAAEQFKEAISYTPARSELICIEHKRWVVEKLCAGWRPMDVTKCHSEKGSKDEINKRHVCIVRSRPDRIPLGQWGDNTTKWDNATDIDLEKLDELDRMSVKLHRVFRSKANEIKAKNNLLNEDGIAAAIRTQVEGNDRAMNVFQEWYVCMKDIWNGDFGTQISRSVTKTRLYEGLKDAFLGAIGTFPQDKRESIKNNLERLESKFLPVLDSMKYRDYKKDDMALIDNIPFVMTYSESIGLVVPFCNERKDNTKLFGNVAAAAVVNPKQITYLCHFENNEDTGDFEESFRWAMAYVEKRVLRSNITLVIAHSSAVAFSKKWETDIIKSSGNRVKRIFLFPIESDEEIAPAFTSYLEDARRKWAEKESNGIFAVEKNATSLSRFLAGSGMYALYDNYTFCSKKMSFENMTEGCKPFSYISRRPFVTVSDIFTFKQANSDKSHSPEFFANYEELWSKYNKDTYTWKWLCDVLGGFSKENDVLCRFPLKDVRGKRAVQKCRYILPLSCAASVRVILNKLMEREIAETGSSVNGYTTDSCEVIIMDRCGYKSLYSQLFFNPYKLMSRDAIRTEDNATEVRVLFDDLIVRGFEFPSSMRPHNQDMAFNLMREFFAYKGYIINLSRQDGGKISFCYATRQIKQLLTSAGRMLEVYVYHKVRELGHFDDVVSSLEVNWGENAVVENEFDCILTSGSKTLFVECKAQPIIDQNFYYKSLALIQQFGIHAKVVLIVDTREKDGSNPAWINDIQRERGDQLNVITIWKPHEITNIGDTLWRIINDRYNKEKTQEVD